MINQCIIKVDMSCGCGCDGETVESVYSTAKMEDYIFLEQEGAIQKSEEIGFEGEIHESTTADGGTLYFPAKTEEEFIEWYRENDSDAEDELEPEDTTASTCGCSSLEAREVETDTYDTADEAREKARELGCSSIHTHEGSDGTTLYMPCESMEAYQEKKDGIEAGYHNAPSCPPGKKMQDGKCVPIAVTLEIQIESIGTTIEASTGSTIITMKGTAFHEGFNKNNWQITNTLAETVASNMIGADVTLNHPAVENGRFTRNMTGGIDEAVVGVVTDAFVLYSGTNWEVKFSADIMREELFSSLESGLWLREGYGVSIGGTGIPDVASEDDNGRALITFSSNFAFDHLAIVHNPAYNRALIDSVERKDIALPATVIYDSDSDLEYPKGEITMSEEINDTEISNSEKILLEAQVAEFNNEKAAKAETERMLLVEEASTLGMKGHEDLSEPTLQGLIASWNDAHPVVVEEVREMKPVGASVDATEVATPSIPAATSEVVANYLNQTRLETPKDVYEAAYNTWVSAWNRTLTPAETKFRAKSFEATRRVD